MQNYGRSAFLKCGVAAIAILAAATPAMAQDAVEEVVVTGSRIARQDWSLPAR